MSPRLSHILLAALLASAAGCAPTRAPDAPLDRGARADATRPDPALSRAEATVEMVAAQREDVVAAVVAEVTRGTPYAKGDGPDVAAFVTVEPFRPAVSGRGGARLRAVQRREVGYPLIPPTPYEVLAEVGRRLAETDRPQTLFVPQWRDAATDNDACRTEPADVFTPWGHTEEPGSALPEVVQRPPEIIGGLQALAAGVVYPEVDRRLGVEGHAHLQFVVDPAGVPECIVGVAAPSDAIAEAGMAAVRAVRFTPGIQNGRAVRVRFSLPIRFVLQ